MNTHITLVVAVACHVILSPVQLVAGERTGSAQTEANPAVTTAQDGVVTPAFRTLTDWGLRLQRAAGPADLEIAADFSFFKNLETGDDTVFNADFFLGWDLITLDVDDKGEWRFELSAEGHLSSETDDRQDAWIFRGGVIRERVMSTEGSLRGFYTSLAIKDETDQDFDTHRLSGEFLFTPTYEALAIGRYRPFLFLPESWMIWRWRPYVIADAGSVINGDGGIQDTNVRLDFRTAVDVELPGIASFLGFSNVILTADNHIHYLPEENETYHYLNASANLMFSENIGLNFNYENGKHLPNFLRRETFSGGLSIKF